MLRATGSLLLAGLLLSSCAALNRMNIVSEPEEIRIGSQIAALIDANARLMDDRMVLQYVEGITNRLASHSDRPDLAYRVRIIEEESINAFALPGGYLYVMTGLLDAAENEAELASVIAHEIAHIARGHAGRRYTKGQLFTLAAVLGGGYIPVGVSGSLARSGLNVGTAMAFLKFSRTDESEADQAGLEYLFNAGYDTVAAETFLMKLIEQREQTQAQAKRKGEKIAKPPPTILSTHPSPESRIQRVKRLAAQFEAAGRDDGREPITDTLYFAMVQDRMESHTERINAAALDVPQLSKKGEILPGPPEDEEEGESEPTAAAPAEKAGAIMSVPVLLSRATPIPRSGAAPSDAKGNPWLVNELPIPRLYERWRLYEYVKKEASRDEPIGDPDFP